MTTTILRASTALLALSAGGCATLSGARTGAVKTDELTARVQTLEGLVSTLSACATKGKPEDSGVLALGAKASGEVTVDGAQWYGSDEMKACVVAQAQAAKLPPWSGGTVSALWTVGTKDHPAPGPLAADPPRFQSELQEQVARTQGTGELGPLIACAQRNLPEGAYAKVQFRLYVFPEGAVVGAAPIDADGEGRDAGFQECLRDEVKGWKFTPFSGPGYQAVNVQFKKGLDETFK